MKTENQEPSEGRLRALIRAARLAPPLPPRFQDAVWRRIERDDAASESASSPSWLDRFVERLLHPRLALAGITALLLLSGLAGVLSGAETARHAAQERYLSAVAPSTVR